MNVKAFKTFGDLAEHFIKCRQQCFPSAATVVGVFDRYDKKLSIKSAERDRRSSSFGDHKVFQLIDGRPIPDWKKVSYSKCQKTGSTKIPWRFGNTESLPVLDSNII
jgi:hypothetical protein